MIAGKINTALIVVISAMILVRATLPYVVEDEINKMIMNNPLTTGQVDDVDLWLLNGQASVEGLQINKAGVDIPTPILSADVIAFSISWNDFFHGRLFGDIELEKPRLNIVDAQDEKDIQTGAEIDWRAALTSFYPFEINRIYVSDGEVHFRNFNSVPVVDIYLEAINAEALNITNELQVDDSKVAQISLEARTIGNGQVSLQSSFNLLRRPSRGKVNLSVSDLELRSINDFAKAYANLDVQSGRFTLEGVVSAKEDEQSAVLDGVLKPTIKNLNVLRWEQDARVQNDPGLILTWEGLVDVVTRLLEVGAADEISTEIPISGSVENPDIGTVDALFGLIKNAINGRFTDSD